MLMRISSTFADVVSALRLGHLWTISKLDDLNYYYYHYYYYILIIRLIRVLTFLYNIYYYIPSLQQCLSLVATDPFRAVYEHILWGPTINRALNDRHNYASDYYYYYYIYERVTFTV